MSQHNSEFGNRNPFARDDVDVNELAEIEQRLKMARPRPVQLDIDAVVRRAGMDTRVHVAADADAGLDTTRSRGWLGTIAGAWACGALVGALVMYVLLGRPATTATPSNPSLAQGTNLPNRPKQTDDKPTSKDDDTAPTRRRVSQPAGSPRWSPAESLVSMLLLDPRLARTASFDDERPALTAGALVQGVAGVGSTRFQRATRAAARERSAVPDSDGGLPEATPAEPGSAAPMTREQLLRELLGKNHWNPIL